MNAFIESLNGWAEQALQFAWPMLWQSSLLIGMLFALDLPLRKRLRPAVRYGLWLVVLLKLVLPPSLAFPTNPGWWLSQRTTVPANPNSPPHAVEISYGPAQAVAPSPAFVPVVVTPRPPRLSLLAGGVIIASIVSFGLLAWMLGRWHRVTSQARRAVVAPARICHLLPELPHLPRLRLTEDSQSPAVCGLFRPVILLPRSLVEQLPPGQLRAVLLHELMHLRRGDVWVNCLQALLQIVYWWHPLLWFANGRIRRIREEAVDDAVMLALNDDADTYAPTLLEVAKLALPRPLATLGLVGILESHSSLRQRIERLMDFRPPRKAGLTLVSTIGVLGFAALAVPMGEAPTPTGGAGSSGQIITNNIVPGPASTASSSDAAADVGRLVQDGKLLYEMGKLDAAQAKLEQALKQDPLNGPASYYLELVRQDRLGPAHNKRGLLVRGTTGRAIILNRLMNTRLDEVSFKKAPLSEVLRALADEARKRDPDKRGVNFIVSSALGADGSPVGTPDYSAASGLSNSPAPARALASLPITIDPPLIGVRLADVLDAVVKVAERPIKYSIEDYAVVFSFKPDHEAVSLYTRTFRVDPNTLIEKLGIAKGPMETNVDGAIFPALLKQFAQVGVDLDPVRNPGKSMFLGGRSTRLLVRGTLQDLDAVEQWIAALNTVPPQINIKIKLVKVAQDDTRALGFDWYLGNVLMNPGSGVTQPGLTPSSNNVATPINAPGVFPGATIISGSNPAGTNGQQLTVGIRPAGGSPLKLTGILTDPQYRVVARALEQRSGTEILAQPQVITVSGRQFQCKVTEVLNVLKLNKQALHPPGVTSTNDDPNAASVIEPMELGLVFDSTPKVMEDGYTIALPLNISLLEFLGYDDTRTNRVAVYVNGKQTWVAPPVPRVHKQELASTINVWDGQTVVLGGLTSENIVKTKDQVPVLGDLPLVGRLFRSESTNTQKNNLLIFITPTIIDAAGNRVHSEDKMPFTTNAIPSQPTR